jgi:hypothetical protein
MSTILKKQLEGSRFLLILLVTIDILMGKLLLLLFFNFHIYGLLIYCIVIYIELIIKPVLLGSSLWIHC